MVDIQTTSLWAKRVWHSAFLPTTDIPERFKDSEPSGITQEVIRTGAQRYMDDFWVQASEGVAPVFLGRLGCYKSYGAAVIARFVHAQSLPVKFVQCGPFFTTVDSNFFSSGMRAYKELVDMAFVVLDDFTQVKSDSRGAELMANLLAERFAAKLPTLVTGNIRGRDIKHGLELIGNQYRPDFARRLRHGAGDFYITV